MYYQYDPVRTLSLKLLVDWQDKLKEEADWIRTLKPKEIELKLKKRYPGILQKVSKKQISSFMGITEETYYRMKD